MDNLTSGRHKRLTKQPPVGTITSNRMHQNNSIGVQRQPSSSQSPASSNDSHDHPSYATSSSSSLERSPNPNSHHSDLSSSRYQQQSRNSYDERTADEFNAHPGTLSTLDSTKASGYQNSLRRPRPPPRSNTTPNPQNISPSFRQKASLSICDRSTTTTTTDADHVSISSSKRYSDEAGKNNAPWKKKSGLSSFIGSVLGSPRSNGVKISHPENPVHVTHVGFDNETGQFTVCTVTSSWYIRMTLRFSHSSIRSKFFTSTCAIEHWLLALIAVALVMILCASRRTYTNVPRACRKNGRGCCRRAEYPRANKRKTPRLSSIS